MKKPCGRVSQTLRIAGASVLLFFAALCVLFMCLPGNNGASVCILLVLAAAAAVPGICLLRAFLRWGMFAKTPQQRAEKRREKAALSALEAQNRAQWEAQHEADLAEKRAVRQQKSVLRADYRAAERKAREDERNTLFLPLVHGLPLPKRTPCTVTFSEDGVRIFASGVEFSLPMERILNVRIQKERRQRTQYVSSAGGAVAGAKIGGALGAALGGRIQPRTIFWVRYFLILTYRKEKRVSYLAFSIPQKRWRAKRLVRRFCPNGAPAPFSL